MDAPARSTIAALLTEAHQRQVQRVAKSRGDDQLRRIEEARLTEIGRALMQFVELGREDEAASRGGLVRAATGARCPETGRYAVAAGAGGST
jgi:hypothetical protein